MEEGMIMNNAATIEASDSRVIRSILRSMVNEHWSVAEALDEYDIPGDLRDSYEAQIAEYFVDWFTDPNFKALKEYEKALISISNKIKGLYDKTKLIIETFFIW